MKKNAYIDISGQKFGRLTAISHVCNESGCVFFRFKCECGNEKIINKANVVRGGTTSCGCYQKERAGESGDRVREWYKNPNNKELHRRNTPSGKRHLWYNHGLSDENRKTRRYIEVSKIYKDWQKLVFNTDKYKCVKCGCCSRKDKKTLCAHHILPWLNWPELRYELKNGVTLCTKCHNKYHSLYGKSENCNHQTLMEFLGD